jgi:hypothetical protein
MGAAVSEAERIGQLFGWPDKRRPDRIFDFDGT